MSYSTTRRVAPKPDTYAFDFVVLRLASATSTSRTGTPTRSDSPRRSAASSWSSSGLNLLKIGSSTTGATNVKKTTNAAASGAATSGHASVQRASATSPKSRTVASTAETANAFATSASQLPSDWVDSPQRRSRT